VARQSDVEGTWVGPAPCRAGSPRRRWVAASVSSAQSIADRLSWVELAIGDAMAATHVEPPECGIARTYRRRTALCCPSKHLSNVTPHGARLDASPRRSSGHAPIGDYGRRLARDEQPGPSSSTCISDCRAKKCCAALGKVRRFRNISRRRRERGCHARPMRAVCCVMATVL